MPDSDQPQQERSLKRLYLFTGKGGVGKSSIALSFAHYLKSAGEKVLYLTFNQADNRRYCEELKIPFRHLKEEDSAHKYMAKKLSSNLIASWISGSHFFQSIYKMVPGLSHMIFMGHMLSLLEEDQKLIIVLDSPSSGHTRVLLESSYNFQRIFLTGIIVDDINNMHRQLMLPNFLKIVVITTPTLMAIQEGEELIEYISSLKLSTKGQLVINNLLSYTIKSDKSLHPYLKSKIDQEQEVLQKVDQKKAILLPHIPTLHNIELVKELSDRLEVLK
jgi:anion-transporting  ArsA/GET3 family ATPase